MKKYINCLLCQGCFTRDSITYLTCSHCFQHSPPPPEAPVCWQSLSIIMYSLGTLTLYGTLRRLECNCSQSQLTEQAVRDWWQNLRKSAEVRSPHLILQIVLELGLKLAQLYSHLSCTEMVYSAFILRV